MLVYAIVAAVLAAVGGALAFKLHKGGRDAQKAETQAQTDKVKRRMDDAVAAGPRTGDDAARRMRDGTF